MNTKKKIFLRLLSAYRIDAESMALMRIAVALVVLIDLAIRSGDAGAFYSDAGIWPRDLVRTFAWNKGYWSLHLFSGNKHWILLLFGCHALCALFLLFGYRTKLATLLTWLFCISLHNRNVFILQAGDDLLRLVLFWGLFLPWGECYSVDANKSREKVSTTWVAALGYLLLIASVYFFSVLSKSSAEWRSNGSAVYFALSLEQIRLPLTGDFLYKFPRLMVFLTHLVFYLEILIPLLILSPFKSKICRTVAFVLIFFLHVGISLSLFVGLFPLISIASGLALIPGASIRSFVRKIGFKKNAALTRLGYTKKWQLNTLLLIFVFTCLLLNLERLTWFSYEPRSEVSYLANVLRLNQNWGMFGPDVLKKDGWFVYYGNDSIGRQWDLRLNQDYVDFSKPKHVVSMYKNDRWRKLAEYMQNNQYSFLRPAYCKFVLAQWNQQHPEKRIALLNLYFMEKENLPGYQTSPVKKSLYCVCNVP